MGGGGDPEQEANPRSPGSLPSGWAPEAGYGSAYAFVAFGLRASQREDGAFQRGLTKSERFSDQAPPRPVSFITSPVASLAGECWSLWKDASQKGGLGAPKSPQYFLPQEDA